MWQLGSNYALLNEFDEEILECTSYLASPLAALTRRPVALANSIIWGVTLALTKKTPVVVKAFSCASIWLAHRHLGDAFRRNWKKTIYAQSFIEAAAINVNLRNKNVLISKFAIVYVFFRTYICRYLLSARKTTKLLPEGRKQQLRRGFVAFMVTLGLTSKPLRPSVTMGLYGWIIALLTNSKMLYFWSCGMLATLGQSVAHGLTKEAPTLVLLQAGMSQLQYEFSHVVFFPNLLFQAVYEQLGF